MLNFLTDAEEDVFPMIPGGKTIHDMVLDATHKPVPVGGHANGNGANGNGGLNGAQQTATAGEYVSEWNDDIESGKQKI